MWKKDTFLHALRSKILLALVPGDFLSALLFLDPSYTLATNPSKVSFWETTRLTLLRFKGLPTALGLGSHCPPGLLGLIQASSYLLPVKLLVWG